MFKFRTYTFVVEQIYNHLFVQCKMGTGREKTIIKMLNYAYTKEWVKFPSMLNCVSPRERGNNIPCCENLR